MAASFRPSPDTFTVEEIPAYLPSGEGEHAYLWIEKRSLTTLDAVRELARRLAIPTRAIGYAGMKDRHATTRQWLSLPALDHAAILRVESPDLRILRVENHRNKLRVGHLRGNRFNVVIFGVMANGEEAREIRGRLAELVRDGLPNPYGPQRFGISGQNVNRGIAILRGDVSERDPRRRKLLLSAVQSAVFNAVLARRARDHLLRRVLDGDILRKTDSGGVFYTDDPAADQLRLDAGGVELTGPIPGSWAREPAAGTTARAIEDEAFAEVGVSREQLAALGKELPGARRPFLVEVTPDDLPPSREISSFSSESGAMELCFRLPAGSYATVLLAALGVSVEDSRPSSAASEPTPGREAPRAETDMV